MRQIIIGLVIVFGASSLALAASPSWLSGLLGTQPAAHHRVVHRGVPVNPKAAQPAAADRPAAEKPAAATTADKPAATPADKPTAADAPPPVPAATPEAPPVPLPRPRPEAQAAPAETPAPAKTSPAEAAPAETPAADKTPDSGATAQPTAENEGESSTPKPPRIYQTACPAVITGLVEAKPLPPINESQCQEQSPLSVTAIMVNGRQIKLTAPAVFNCSMASDLPLWVTDVDNYIQSTQKTRIKAVMVGGSYECRPRNVEGGSSDLSEHGRADALDFVGFTLEDGRQLTVTADYNSSDAKISRLMHFAHDAACTRFTTVLGPEANALHHDHFHLDLGCHGKACIYRLCE